jgi:hypothetical protein
MLPSQCKYLNLDYPNYFRNWINIKKVKKLLFPIKKNKI